MRDDLMLKRVMFRVAVARCLIKEFRKHGIPTELKIKTDATQDCPNIGVQASHITMEINDSEICFGRLGLKNHAGVAISDPSCFESVVKHVKDWMEAI